MKSLFAFVTAFASAATVHGAQNVQATPVSYSCHVYASSMTPQPHTIPGSDSTVVLNFVADAIHPDAPGASENISVQGVATGSLKLQVLPKQGGTRLLMLLSLKSNMPNESMAAAYVDSAQPYLQVNVGDSTVSVDCAIK